MINFIAHFVDFHVKLDIFHVSEENSFGWNAQAGLPTDGPGRPALIGITGLHVAPLPSPFHSLPIGLLKPPRASAADGGRAELYKTHVCTSAERMERMLMWAGWKGRLVVFFLYQFVSLDESSSVIPARHCWKLLAKIVWKQISHRARVLCKAHLKGEGIFSLKTWGWGGTLPLQPAHGPGLISRSSPIVTCAIFPILIRHAWVEVERQTFAPLIPFLIPFQGDLSPHSAQLSAQKQVYWIPPFSHLADNKSLLVQHFIWVWMRFDLSLIQTHAGFKQPCSSVIELFISWTPGGKRRQSSVGATSFFWNELISDWRTIDKQVGSDKKHFLSLAEAKSKQMKD